MKVYVNINIIQHWDKINENFLRRRNGNLPIKANRKNMPKNGLYSKFSEFTIYWYAPNKLWWQNALSINLFVHNIVSVYVMDCVMSLGIFDSQV